MCIYIFLLRKKIIEREENYWKIKEKKKWLVVHILTKKKTYCQCYYVLFWEECYWSVFLLYILLEKYIRVEKWFFFNLIVFYILTKKKNILWMLLCSILRGVLLKCFFYYIFCWKNMSGWEMIFFQFNCVFLLI
jgi:hypothetical protein